MSYTINPPPMNKMLAVVPAIFFNAPGILNDVIFEQDSKFMPKSFELFFIVNDADPYELIDGRPEEK